MPQPPPPLPQQNQPIGYRQPGTPSAASGVEQYNRVAETVGMMPTLRIKDNVIQAVVVLIGTVLGAIVGYFVSGQDPRAATLGAVIGLVIFGLVSGIVLMVIGWKRARRK